jgi:soluble lytic murein transglycosylase-like protein
MIWMTRTVGWRVTLAMALVVALCAPLAAPRSAAASETYVVEWGDTLSHIAEAYGITVAALAARNNITNPDLIVTGQTLVIDTNRSTYENTAQGGPEPVVQPAQQPVSRGYTYLWEDPDAVPPYYDRALIRTLLVDAAQRYGWDPYLIMAQAWQESSWRQNQVSWVGAIGVMQVMPSTALEMMDWYFGHEMRIWSSAYDNIEVGVAYLTVLYGVTGSVELALASYYQGWNSVQRDGFFPDTQEYVDRILMFRDRFAAGQMP